MNFSPGTLEELVSQGLLRRGDFTRQHIRDYLDQARDQIDSARHQRKPKDRLMFAYHAMFSTVLAVLAHKGYRPATQAHHVATIEGGRRALPDGFRKNLDLMDAMRPKRHDVLYPGSLRKESVSAQEALQALQAATRFVEDISQLLNL